MDKILINEAVNDLYTVQDLIRWTISRFNAADIYYGHGTDNAWDEACHLIFPLLYLPLEFPETLYSSRLTASEKYRVVDQVIKRVQRRIPVPYLTNKAWFCGHEFYVNEHVLIPRSPIGELIDSAFDGIISGSPEHILDLCCGSGCIAIACAYVFPDAGIDAVDISQEALLVAEKNIADHGLENQVVPIHSDLFKSVPEIKYDLIVTNPPYVDQEDMSDMPEEFKAEPRLALEAGADGLDLVYQILFNADHYLSEKGVLICEVGNSAVHLTEQFPQIPFKWLTFEHGGEGVFVLTKQQLSQYKESIKPYID